MGTPPVAIDKLDAYGINAICHDIVSGKSMTEMCRELCIGYGSMSTWISAQPDRSARVVEARRESAKLWDEVALAQIMSAETQMDMTRAKEAAFHLRWRSSKIDPKGYGDRVQTEVTGKLTLEQLVAASRTKPETEGE